MIKTTELSFGYKKGKRVLQDISFSIAPGNIYGLLGDNGVGKSTLIHLMVGLLKPDKGSVCYDDINMFKHRAESLANIYLVSEVSDLPHISLRDYIKITAPFYSKFSMEDMRGYLSAFDLTEDMHLKALSMGQKKKIIISFALATNVSLLLLDEPTNGLDITAKIHFRKFISSYVDSGDKSVVISTHQLRDVDSLLDSLLILKGERLSIDSSLYLIGRAFRFELYESGDLPKDYIFAQPSPGGYMVVSSRESDDEGDGEVNIELFYQAFKDSPERILAGLNSLKIK